MVRIRVRKGLKAAKDMGIEKGEDGKAFRYGIQGGDSGHLARNGGEGNARRRPPPDGLLGTDGAVVGSQLQQDCSRVARGAG